jgi:hypothetical protein
MSCFGRRVVVAAAIGALALSVGAASAFGVSAGSSPWDDVVAPPSIEAMFDDPLFRQAQLEALRREQERLRERAEPAAVAERADSKDEFAGLTDAAALNLAQDTFPSMLSASLDGFELPAGVRIVKLLDESSARVVDSSGKGSLLLSSEPIAVKDAGALEPVDLELERTGGEFVPENSGVDVSIPVEVDEFLRVGVTDLGLRPHGASPDTGVEEDGRVFYAGIERDTDFVAMPRRGGAEVAWQLRSQDAPEELVLDLSLPGGATAELVTWINRAGLSDAAADGSVVIRKYGAPAEVIAAPHVVDADGVSIDARYELREGKLAVLVPHRAKDVRYPLLVDPAVHEVWGVPDLLLCGGAVGTVGRWTYQQWGSPFEARCTSPEVGGGGLFVRAPGPATYNDAAVGQWVWSAPSGAYLMNMWFDGVRHRAAGTTLYTGLWGMNGWESVYGDTGDVWNGIRSHAPNSPYNSFTAVMALWENGTYWRPHDGLAGTTGVNIRLGDLDAPVVDITSSSVPLSTATQQTPRRHTAWIDPTRTPNPNMTFSATDGGLGLATVGLAAEPWNGQDATLIGRYNATCAGHRSSPCPRTLTPTFSLSNMGGLGEGRISVRPIARDIVDNTGYGAYAFDLRLDKTAPTITLSGELVDHVTDNQLSVNPKITVNAKDGSLASPATQRSGVKSMRLWLDGNSANPLHTYTDPQTPTSCDNCERQLDWTVPRLSLIGAHTITVEATDYLGHIATKTLAVSVESTGPSLTLTPASTVPSDPAHVVLSFAATDSDTGVSRVRFSSPDHYLWSQARTDDHGCVGGTQSPCATSRTGTVNLGDLPEGQPSITVTATDAVGNTTSQTIDVNAASDPRLLDPGDFEDTTGDFGTPSPLDACARPPDDDSSILSFCGQDAAEVPDLADALAEKAFPGGDDSASASAITARSQFGIAEENPYMFDEAAFSDLNIKRVRKQVSWDLTPNGAAPPDGPDNSYNHARYDHYAKTRDFLVAAKARGIKVLISFRHRRKKGPSKNPSTPQEYRAGIADFFEWTRLNDFRSIIEGYTAYNEPNLFGVSAKLAGQFYVELADHCNTRTPKSHAIAGDFTDSGPLNGYWNVYYKYARKARIDTWGFHPYIDIRSRDSRFVKTKRNNMDRFISWVKNTPGGATKRIFLTEVGGLVEKHGDLPWPENPTYEGGKAGSLAQANYLFDTVIKKDLISRLYYYQWRGSEGGWDSGLLEPNSVKTCQYYKYRRLTAGTAVPAGVCP